MKYNMYLSEERQERNEARALNKASKNKKHTKKVYADYIKNTAKREKRISWK